MGAFPYWYVVPYEADVNSVLQELRGRELVAGRYNPLIRYPKFPVDGDAGANVQHHASFDEAIEAAGEEGTRSIIDLQFVSDDAGLSQVPDMAVHPLTSNDLKGFFGSDTPTIDDIRKSSRFWDSISRGSGVYIVLYKNNAPHELFIAGFSFD